jgi:hypothetical protein
MSGLTVEGFMSIMVMIYEVVGKVFDTLDGIILIDSLVPFTLLDLLVSLEFLFLLIGFINELREVSYGS